MKLKKIYCRYIPAKGYIAIMILIWMVVRQEYRDSEPWFVENHENTHLKQEIELGAVGAVIGLVMLAYGMGWWSALPLFLFYWWYGVEFVVKLPFCRFNVSRTYMSVSLEREAYAYHFDKSYLERRRHFAWIKYIFTLKTEKL